MTIWDVVVALYVVAVGVIIWRQEETEGWGDWLIRTLLLSSLIAGPYVFWDDIAAYWHSSGDGPVQIDTGWW